MFGSNTLTKRAREGERENPEMFKNKLKKKKNQLKETPEYYVYSFTQRRFMHVNFLLSFRSLLLQKRKSVLLVSWEVKSSTQMT